MGMFKQKEMKRKRPIENNWYDWLINYVPKPIRKIVGGFTNTVVSLFKTNSPKDYGKKKPCTGEERNQTNQRHKNNLKKHN